MNNIENTEKEKLYILNKNPKPSLALNTTFIAKSVSSFVYKYGEDNKYYIIKVSKYVDGKKIRLEKDGMPCALMLSHRYGFKIKVGTIFQLDIIYHRSHLGWDVKVIKDGA